MGTNESLGSARCRYGSLKLLFHAVFFREINHFQALLELNPVR